MNFREFKKRLFHLGICKVESRIGLGNFGNQIKKDVYLYPKPEVPIALLNLNIAGEILPFMITARPYHNKESNSIPHSQFLDKNQDLTQLKDDVQKNKTIINLHNHFYPHIRGLFAGVRKNNIFWYPLRASVYWLEFGKKIQKALDKRKLGFIEIYEATADEDRTYHKVWEELSTKSLVSMKPAWINFSPKQVSAEEFIHEKNSLKDLLVYYPLRIPTIKETLPLIVTNRTHQESKNSKPAILGIYAQNGLKHGYGWKGGILRIKNQEFAKYISQQISDDFGMPIDTVLFTPQKGKPKYERISSD
jgi:hypothetical protein